ncbi:MAG: DNA photolyase family protein [Bdellovibrionales bacterium]|nr:DNA photolyase family protein [Bdellovibrionales bacterium]
MQNEKWGLHWFRRDLRIPGNEALKQNLKVTQGKTLGIFCFDSHFLSREDFSHNRFAFFLKTLESLRTDLKEQGGDLLVVDCLPYDFFAKLFLYCRWHKISLPEIVTSSRDYEPFARQRDERIKTLLKKEGVSYLDCRDHLIFEPHEVLKSNKPNDFYQIYSPFSRKWFSLLESSDGQARVNAHSNANEYFSRKNRKTDLFKMRWGDLRKDNNFPFLDAAAKFIEINSKKVTVEIPEAGFFAAYAKLQKFKKNLDSYNEQRNFPGINGTSQLSLYLKNGTLTPTQIVQNLKLDGKNWKAESGRNRFLKEIVWREFYYSILFHRPEVEKESFNPKYKDLKWENDENLFKKWQEGLTGFPIVDAGMRQLKQTGWMHNRVRMIVASFLTKDLLIDWRWGENHFMKELLDGDLASNNGGWQWAASTGCDPQPYFRVFNPWLQGAKFDPEGEYIKTFIPELKAASRETLHDPNADRGPWKYPKPIINHGVQKHKALSLYKVK